jgi:hypothetical protein
MATPTDHALLSASSSHRWLNCTAAPHYEEQFPSETSVFADEGTLAHKFAELAAKYNFNVINKRKFNSEIKKLQKDELYKDEMLETSKFYAEYLHQKSLSYNKRPYVVQEVKVDFSDYAPEGFGTCDCVMIGDDHLHITDYKHGKGVEVSAANNSQMRLYALGALKQYSAIFSGIKRVSMAIVQPRITEDISEEELTIDELLAWGENIKPLAQKAFTGEGAEFHQGTWCKFCKGKNVCKARAENATALEDFMNIPIEGKLKPEQRLVTPTVLTDDEVADLLVRGADLVAWFNDLQEYALGAILQGREIKGFKVVAGRSNRAFTDQDGAIEAIKAAGYEETVLRKAPEYKSLSELEKLVGKKDFESLVGKFITKPLGKPTLTTADDKREPYNAAVADFKEAATQ